MDLLLRLGLVSVSETGDNIVYCVSDDSVRDCWIHIYIYIYLYINSRLLLNWFYLNISQLTVNTCTLPEGAHNKK